MKTLLSVGIAISVFSFMVSCGKNSEDFYRQPAATGSEEKLVQENSVGHPDNKGSLAAGSYTYLLIASSQKVWPDFPRAVTKTAIGKFCGGILHGASCAADPKIELALEQEFWLLLGNLDAETSPAFKGLGDWVFRTERYLGYRYLSGIIKGKRHYKGPKHAIARLTMLLAAANVAMFRAYEVEAFLMALSQANLPELIRNASTLPSLHYFLEGLKYADESYYLDPHQPHAANFLFPTIAFIQLAVPIPYLDLGKLVPNTAGGIGLHRSYPLGWDGAFDSLAMTVNTQKPCASQACGSDLRSTEAAFTYGMSLQNIDAATLPSSGVRHDYLNMNNILPIADSIFFAPSTGACETYACQATSSLSPFKKISGLIISAEIRGKMGKVDEAKAIFKKARTLANQLGYPFMERITEIENRLFGLRPDDADGILQQWSGRSRKSIGFIQLPLPPSNSPAACSSCHFGGKLQNPDFYKR